MRPKEFTILVLLTLLPLFLETISLNAYAQTVTVTVAADNPATPDVPPLFLGLSYEMVLLNLQHGHYYFDVNDTALVNIFKTLGVKSLRVGGSAVDYGNPVPQEKEIDGFFQFARAAGTKVIYSFRLNKGDPALTARLATYIAAHYGDSLDAFAIGNEPDFYQKTFDQYFAAWKPYYDAILHSVPDARIDAPSAALNYNYARQLAEALYSDGHLSMLSGHYYFLGSGPEGGKNPSETRARFLSNNVHSTYEKDFSGVPAEFAAKGIPYRMDEVNSCFKGGAKDSSDTYASTLWALDCIHWWASHHILGMNFHTGEYFRNDVLMSQNYSCFFHRPDFKGIVVRPQAYALLAFTQGAHGRSQDVTVETDRKLDFNAYAYRDRDGSLYVTLINKTYGGNAQSATVSLKIPSSNGTGLWQEMDLMQKDKDVAAQGDIYLGGAPIDDQGGWSGGWQKIVGETSTNLTLALAPTSATLIHFLPATSSPKVQ